MRLRVIGPNGDGPVLHQVVKHCISASKFTA